MRPGHESLTAVHVCIARALVQTAGGQGPYSDPTALELLPAPARAFVERARAGAPAGLGERVRRAFHLRQVGAMVVRTLAIDAAVRAAGSPQLVILGAGLDGRAWRMAELRETIVFEVDHPDSQRRKRERTARLIRTAREVRFVPVDFTRQALDAALAAADHSGTRPTTWIWEGVVMYLSAEEVEASLAALAARSAPGSRLVLLYHRPRPIRAVIGVFVRWLGEPLRSAFTPAELRGLLARYGFDVLEDRGLDELGAARGRRHVRLAIAERA